MAAMAGGLPNVVESALVTVISSFFAVKQLAGSISMGTANLGAVSDPATQRAKEHRQREYIDTLRCNLASPIVRRVVLLVEGPHSMQILKQSILSDPRLDSHDKQKLSPVLVASQPSYSELFRIPSTLLTPSLPPCRSSRHFYMVCNSDIHMPHDPARWFPVNMLQNLFDAFDNRHGHREPSHQQSEAQSIIGLRRKTRLVLALTRYEGELAVSDTVKIPLESPLVEDYRGSHDAFLFRDPLPDSFLRSVHHPQNCYKAENVVIHELTTHADALVLNPSYDFRLVHRHEADVRQWLPPVDETRYGRSKPVTMDEALAAIQNEVI